MKTTESDAILNIMALEGWMGWMSNWVFYDESTRMYSTYEPDNQLLCTTYVPQLAIESFKHTTVGA